jgi:hypothetical protein
MRQRLTADVPAAHVSAQHGGGLMYVHDVLAGEYVRPRQIDNAFRLAVDDRSDIVRRDGFDIRASPEMDVRRL